MQLLAPPEERSPLSGRKFLCFSKSLMTYLPATNMKIPRDLLKSTYSLVLAWTMTTLSFLLAFVSTSDKVPASMKYWYISYVVNIQLCFYLPNNPADIWWTLIVPLCAVYMPWDSLYGDPQTRVPQMAWGAWFKNDEAFITSYVPKNIM